MSGLYLIGWKTTSGRQCALPDHAAFSEVEWSLLSGTWSGEHEVETEIYAINDELLLDSGQWLTACEQETFNSAESETMTATGN